MTVDLPLLLVALALLLIPRQWLRLGAILKTRRRSAGAVRSAGEPWNAREAGDPRVRMADEFAKPRNYVDLLRAGGASLALWGGWGISPVLAVSAGAPRNAAWGVMAVQALMVLVGLLVQTVRFEKGQLRFSPPIFFIAGLSVGMCHSYGAITAFMMIWAIHSMFSGAQGFLSGYAVCILVFGHLFAGRIDLSVLLMGGLCFLPVLLSLLAGRPLVIMSRRGKKSA